MEGRVIKGEIRPDVFGDSIVPLTAWVDGKKKVIGHASVNEEDGTFQGVIDDPDISRLVSRGVLGSISAHPDQSKSLIWSPAQRI